MYHTVCIFSYNMFDEYVLNYYLQFSSEINVFVKTILLQYNKFYINKKALFRFSKTYSIN
jgi:hypothetical protein